MAKAKVIVSLQIPGQQMQGALAQTPVGTQFTCQVTQLQTIEFRRINIEPLDQCTEGRYFFVSGKLQSDLKATFRCGT